MITVSLGIMHGSGGKCQLDSSMVNNRRGRSGVEGGQMRKKEDKCSINDNSDKCYLITC